MKEILSTAYLFNRSLIDLFKKVIFFFQDFIPSFRESREGNKVWLHCKDENLKLLGSKWFFVNFVTDNCDKWSSIEMKSRKWNDIFDYLMIKISNIWCCLTRWDKMKLFVVGSLHWSTWSNFIFQSIFSVNTNFFWRALLLHLSNQLPGPVRTSSR